MSNCMEVSRPETQLELLFQLWLHTTAVFDVNGTPSPSLVSFMSMKPNVQFLISEMFGWLSPTVKLFFFITGGRAKSPPSTLFET